MLKKLCAFALLLSLVCGMALADTPLLPDQPFVLRNGSREDKRIAITMDDCYQIEYVQALFDLAQETGIKVTFYPIGVMIKEEDAELWRAIAQSDCEIGSHMWNHTSARTLYSRTIIRWARQVQEQLDKVLGYHYEIRSLRPPFGNVEDDNGSVGRIKLAFETAGYHHVVNWDVSQTDPNKVVPLVRNGSILLFHARKKDFECIKKVLPQLLELGFEPVTVSELLGLGEKQISDEQYVFVSSDYYD